MGVLGEKLHQETYTDDPMRKNALNGFMAATRFLSLEIDWLSVRIRQKSSMMHQIVITKKLIHLLF